jgi:hypothetical protein
LIFSEVVFNSINNCVSLSGKIKVLSPDREVSVEIEELDLVELVVKLKLPEKIPKSIEIPISILFAATI